MMALTDRELEMSVDVSCKVTQEPVVSLSLHLGLAVSGKDACTGSDAAVGIGTVPETLLTSRPAIVIVDSRPRL